MTITMLTLTMTLKTPAGYTARIQGPKGEIEIQDLVWIVDRQDILELYYWQSQAVLDGLYHCCLSIPGKVKLL
jgi:hypothetical protein